MIIGDKEFKYITNKNFERDSSWRNSGKSSDKFTDAQLNDFYLYLSQGSAVINVNGLIYVESEMFSFPQTYNSGTTEEQDKSLNRISEEYAKRTKNAGFKVKVVRIEMPIGNTNRIDVRYIVYRRDTSNSDLNRIPKVNKMYLNHITKFTRIPMKKVLY